MCADPERARHTASVKNERDASGSEFVLKKKKQSEKRLKFGLFNLESMLSYVIKRSQMSG